MWRLIDESSDTTIYLLGSMHALKPDDYPLPEIITNAYNDSDCLTVECDMIEYYNDFLAQYDLQKKMMYTDGDTLSNHIDKETIEKCKKILEDNNDPFVEQIEMFKPCILTSELLTICANKLGLSNNYGIDMYLLNKAHTDNKEIVEVESVEFQMNMQLNFSDELYELMLDSYVETDDAFDISVKSLEELYVAWRTGDIQKIEELNEDENTTEEEKKILDDYNKQMFDYRNIGMADKVKELIQNEKDTLFVVGALHMIGDKGIISLLEDRGYTIERIN